MEAIICCLFGIFVGMAVAGYMYVNECKKKEEKNIIQEQVIENLQKELSLTKQEKEVKDNVIATFIKAVEINDYGRPDIHLNKIKELVDDWKSNN